MSARVERAVSTKPKRVEHVIVDFNAERLQAPFLLRCGAVLIDYILLVSVPVISLLLVRVFEDEPSKFLKGATTGWLIMILLALTNFVIIPMFSGQTIGKILTGLKIVSIDGSSPTASKLLIRHLIGYPLTVITGGLGFLFAVVNRSGRALHDFLAGTVVVYGRRRMEKKEIK
jgi:uncharacterized RDD family membrane protein YckC